VNIPGFTAEAATYKRAASFHMRATGESRPPDGSVTMAGCPAGTTSTCTCTPTGGTCSPYPCGECAYCSGTPGPWPQCGCQGECIRIHGCVEGSA
jgi:hypothetical protein